ncbi:hypothetical protein [Vibrio nomapromontoriensis]|uniref:hypothetical protein n=1 Tax=Vibrio nomapromontoriensis TaxID=2910246 RepID=UPI003D0F01FC
MDSIPKVFWYSLSLCMFLITSAMIYLMVNSSRVSIEYSNAKVEIANAKEELVLESSALATQKANFKIETAELTNQLEALAKNLELKQTLYTSNNVVCEAPSLDPKSTLPFLKQLETDPKVFEDIKKQLSELSPETYK